MQYSKTQALLGTLIEITIISENPKTPERIDYVFDYFSSIEEEFSRFLPHSALSILNREKIQKVSSRFITLMKLCRQRYQETNGLFNPLVQVS
jgi:thiamine biosynthesis lipoprotein ApbE